MPRKGQDVGVPTIRQRAGRGSSAGEDDDGDGARKVLGTMKTPGWKRVL